MQALIDKLFENKSMIVIASAIALLALVVLMVSLYRLVFGRKLRLPGGAKGRLPRLAIVDAFDLDRQRQLVIVRRDNVEHLIMIGGPNDLVIETEIIRAEVREGRVRDMEPALASVGGSWPETEVAARQAAAAPAQPTRGKNQFPSSAAP